MIRVCVLCMYIRICTQISAHVYSYIIVYKGNTCSMKVIHVVVCIKVLHVI